MSRPTPDQPQATSTEDLHHQIDRTREEIAGTVAALSAKADVKGRAKEKAREKVTQVREKVGEIGGKLPARVSERVPGGPDGRVAVLTGLVVAVLATAAFVIRRRLR